MHIIKKLKLNSNKIIVIIFEILLLFMLFIECYNNHQITKTITHSYKNNQELTKSIQELTESIHETLTKIAQNPTTVYILNEAKPSNPKPTEPDSENQQPNNQQPGSQSTGSTETKKPE